MDTSALAERYARVKMSIPAHVKLIAVSKTRSVQEIQALYDLGHRAFGENYPQELSEKQLALPADIEWHFIGHLQRNKVKLIAPFVHLVHAVDSLRLMDVLNERARAVDRSIDVLFQVHIAREETKHGFLPDELHTLFRDPDLASRWPHLRKRGLMGMATNTEDRTQVQEEFEGLARLFGTLRSRSVLPGTELTELSMGMSDDLRIAIAAGSTMVRVGTSIFGPRG